MLMLLLPPHPRAQIPRLYRVLWLCISLFMVHTSHASCKRTENLYVHTSDIAIIKLRFGHINLTDSVLQPYGTVLASIVSPATDYAYKNAQPDTVLWECDKEDVDKIQFLVANNADEVYGGWHEIGQADHLENVYATAFDNVGLHLSMDGVALSQYWQPVPVKTYHEFRGKNPITGKLTDRIAIRLRDVPDMEARLYKVQTKISTIFPLNHVYPGCNLRSSRITYICLEPNGYIQLDGPGILHDYAGEWARYHYLFYGANNGLVWGMYKSFSFSNEPTCVIKSTTAHVRFAPISVQQLQDGGETSAKFSVEVDCNDDPKISGTVDNKTAIGVQVSTGAFEGAQKLRLVNQDNGVEYLLSDQYGKDSSLAKGVGIRLYNERDHQRWFVGQPGSVGAGHPQGASAGWYSILQGATPVGDVSSGSRRHRLDFTARLVKLPKAQEITPGKVRATAHVLVKVQ